MLHPADALLLVRLLATAALLPALHSTALLLGRLVVTTALCPALHPAQRCQQSCSQFATVTRQGAKIVSIVIVTLEAIEL